MKIRGLRFVMMFMLTIPAVMGNAQPRAGDVVFESSFNTPAGQKQWSQADFAQWSTAGQLGKTSLCITVPAIRASGGHMVSMPIDLRGYRGCQLFFECMARAENVSKPAATYLGIKYMLHYKSATMGNFWKNEDNVYGTFDWRKLQFSAFIAADATAGEINLGLQDSSGTVWFDAIRIAVAKGPPVLRPKPPANPPLAFRGHNLPRLRGVMSPNMFRDDDMRVLGTEWKANVIRWQITRNWAKAGTDRDLEEYDRWMNSKLDELDKVLVACRRYGIRVIVDMHSPPGGRYANNDLAIFNETKYQDHFVTLWEKIAQRYKGNPAIWGYDLINEPVQNRPSPPGVPDYLGAQVRAAKAIRAIDPNVPVFIEAAEWDSAEGFGELEPVAIPSVIYEVHMYAPHQFTHQGVHGKWTPTVYPGEIGDSVWNKDRLRKVLQPVRDFQLAYNVHIYVGEFSAIRWAPGAANYLRDCIDLFEEYGWDWTYHAYREWEGWSVEHGNNPNDNKPVLVPSDRKQLLLDWFGKNVQQL